MRFSILHPTARPDGWKATYDAWAMAATDVDRLEYLLAVDSKDLLAIETGPFLIANCPILKRDAFPRFDFKRGSVVANKGRECYVDAVNAAAARAAGDCFIIIADDIFPPPNWDTELEALIAAAGNPPEYVVWASTNTPHEFEGIMPMPILSKSRYDRLGYALYPKYESMYSDNDICEHSQLDAQRGICALIMAPRIQFDHRHAGVRPEYQENWDAVYEHQNRLEAYALGKKIFAARKACGFEEIREVKIEKKRIAIAVLGETFSRQWIFGEPGKPGGWTDLLAKFGGVHDLNVVPGYSSNIYLSRAAIAELILDGPPSDYVLWIDDDNPPSGDHLNRLILDLETNPEISMVAGWTLTQEGRMSCGVQRQGVRIPATLDDFLTALADLQEIDWTGFPMVLMRAELLAQLGPEAFLPQRETFTGEHATWGLLGEDVGFCRIAREHDYRLFVDRRVKLDHLKLMDCADVTRPSAPLASGDLGRMLAEDYAKPNPNYWKVYDTRLGTANASDPANSGTPEANKKADAEMDEYRRHFQR